MVRAYSNIQPCLPCQTQASKSKANEGKKKWPTEFRNFIPSVINCASWVGYDLDGRADISWIDSFYFRLKEH